VQTFDGDIMKRLPVFLIALASVIACGCTSHTAVHRIDWHSRTAQVNVGMTRSEVEKLLPPLPGSPCPSAGGGGSYTVFYWVATNLQVRLTYGSSHTDLSNRLLSEPDLSERPEAVGPMKIRDTSNKPLKATSQ
jgi:hypothetical protein